MTGRTNKISRMIVRKAGCPSCPLLFSAGPPTIHRQVRTSISLSVCLSVFSISFVGGSEKDPSLFCHPTAYLRTSGEVTRTHTHNRKANKQTGESFFFLFLLFPSFCDACSVEKTISPEKTCSVFRPNKTNQTRLEIFFFLFSLFTPLSFLLLRCLLCRNFFFSPEQKFLAVPFPRRNTAFVSTLMNGFGLDRS